MALQTTQQGRGRSASGKETENASTLSEREVRELREYVQEYHPVTSYESAIDINIAHGKVVEHEAGRTRARRNAFQQQSLMQQQRNTALDLLVMPLAVGLNLAEQFRSMQMPPVPNAEQHTSQPEYAQSILTRLQLGLSRLAPILTQLGQAREPGMSSGTSNQQSA